MKNQKMNNKVFKKLIPYFVAFAVFLGIIVVYFSPVFEGKSLKQHDIAMFKGMSKEIVDFRAKTGEEPLWTNSMFGGMPAWQISVKYAGNLTQYVDKALQLGLPSPANLVFLYFLGFFVLLLVMGVDVWLSIVGAMAFALSSYFFIILGAGHTSKAHAIGYMAPVLAGILWTFRGKYLKGSALTALALALEIKAGHLQITYYLLILILVVGIYLLIENLRAKQMKHFFKATTILLFAALLAIAANLTSLWGTWEYGKYTMRGKPELTKEKENKSSGLDRDYITAWSYGIGETWSLMIPNVKGGASGYLDDHDAAMKKSDPVYKKYVARQNAYWGDQPGTSGPVYVGAILVFLFVLGLLLLDDHLKWALLAATVLAIMLSWGKNFMGLTNFFIDYVPAYNKFRAVSMILVIVELTIPLLAILTLDKLIRHPDLLLKRRKAFYTALGLTAGISLLFYLFPTAFFSFFSKMEWQQFAQMKKNNDPVQIAAFMNSIENVRIAIFRQDAARSFFFIFLAAILILLFASNKLNKTWLLLGMGLLILVDMSGVDKRYLNDDHYEFKRVANQPFSETLADRFIFRDKQPDFRVLDLTKNVFNDASTSYFHFSIGGYHGAKLQRYQDLIEAYLAPEIADLRKMLSKKATLGEIDSSFRAQKILNMLNTKYYIYHPKAQPLLNTYAYGNAWMVHELKWVNNADEEIAALAKVDLQSVAVADKQFAHQVKQIHFPQDTSAKVLLTAYAPNHLVYHFESKEQQLVVFSEIYYPKGWEAFVDGKPVPYFRVDYVLRAMVVPAGKHRIEFKFEPRAWRIGEHISLVSSLILLLLVASVAAFEIKKLLKKEKIS